VRTAPLTDATAGPLTMTAVEEVAEADAAPKESWPTAVLVLYLTGAAVVIGHTFFSAEALRRKVSAGRRQRIDGIRTVVLKEDIPSFTFGTTVFIGRKDLEENPAIFWHETMHVRCRHYLDLFLFRAVQLVWWWNPLVWLARTELGLLHEYEADEGVINQGIDATQYQLLLVRKAVGEQRFSLASGFQHAQLKNRITMMLKPCSNGWMRLSYLAVLPVLAIFVYACNPSKNNKAPAEEAPAVAEETVTPAAAEPAATPDAIPFQLVEVKPSFNGGDANEFSKWVNSQLVYPDEAKKSGIQGRVAVQFTVEPDGSVANVKVLRGVNDLLDQEAIRVISSSPKWKPGIQDGQPVRVTFTFPIIYQLR
jgi:TonB family protein